LSSNGKLSPSELAPIAQGQLRKDAAAAWNAMNVEARKNGIELVPTGSKSSYRTYAQQQELWNLYQSGRGNLAASPGTSNHGWGLAIDLATPAMRSMVDKIGAKYGFSKRCSDAQSEWWHIKYDPACNHATWSGTDPGPTGQAQPKPTPEPIEDDDMIAAVVKKNGALEVFVEKKDGRVFHTWQGAENGKWYTTDGGKTIAWQPMGTPGGK
jgi:hypothetical protein